MRWIIFFVIGWLFNGVPLLAEDVVLPNFHLLGQSVNTAERLMAADQSAAISPTKIIVEVKNAKIDGLVLEYPKSTKFTAVVRQIDKEFRESKSPKSNTDLKIALWRDRQRGLSIIVSEETNSLNLIVKYWPPVPTKK